MTSPSAPHQGSAPGPLPFCTLPQGRGSAICAPPPEAVPTGGLGEPSRLEEAHHFTCFLRPPLLLTPRERLVHAQHLLPVCSFSNIHGTHFMALPSSAPVGLRTPLLSPTLPRAAPPTVALSPPRSSGTCLTIIHTKLSNSWGGFRPLQRVPANPGSLAHSPGTGLWKGNSCSAPCPPTPTTVTTQSTEIKRRTGPCTVSGKGAGPGGLQ